MIKHIIDQRTVTGDPRKYAQAVKDGLQAYWKGEEIEVILVDSDSHDPQLNAQISTVPKTENI